MIQALEYSSLTQATERSISCQYCEITRELPSELVIGACKFLCNNDEKSRCEQTLQKRGDV